MIEDVLTVQDDVVPLDRADVAQQRELDSVALRIGRANDARDVLGLPVDDARHDQGEAAIE